MAYENLQDGGEFFEGEGAGWGSCEGKMAVGGDVGYGSSDVFVAEIIMPTINACATPLASAIPCRKGRYIR